MPETPPAQRRARKPAGGRPDKASAARLGTAILAAAEHFAATAADLLERYKTVTEGMPLTERAPSFTEMVV